MDAVHLDAIARRLVNAAASRRRIVALAGGLLMMGLPNAGDATAGAGKARRRCLKKGGVYIRRGACHCGQTCAAATPCGRKPGCVCRATAEGRGFCVGLMSPSYGCSSTSECETGFTCTVEFACAGTGQACTTGADCKTISPDLGCIDDACQATYCANPCG